MFYLASSDEQEKETERTEKSKKRADACEADPAAGIWIEEEISPSMENIPQVVIYGHRFLLKIRSIYPSCSKRKDSFTKAYQ